MYCNNNCRICNNLIISTSVTVAAVDGVDADAQAAATLNETFDFAITVTQVD